MLRQRSDNPILKKRKRQLLYHHFTQCLKTTMIVSNLLNMCICSSEFYFPLPPTKTKKKKEGVEKLAICTNELHEIIKLVASLIGLYSDIFIGRLCPSLLLSERQSGHRLINCLHPRYKYKQVENPSLTLLCYLYWRCLYL